MNFKDQRFYLIHKISLHNNVIIDSYSRYAVRTVSLLFAIIYLVIINFTYPKALISLPNSMYKLNYNSTQDSELSSLKISSQSFFSSSAMVCT